MNKVLIFAVAMFWSAPASSLTLSCVSVTPTHERWAMKTRPAPTTPTVVTWTPASLVTVKDVLAWPVPYVGSWAKMPAEVNPRETGTATLHGFVRLAKVSPDDCDIHMEIADDIADGSPRVIVEIPQSQNDVYQQAAQLFNLTHRGHEHKFKGTQAVKVLVTGWIFLDVSHQTKAPSKEGHAHGSRDVRTLWEVHPVFALAEMPGGSEKDQE
jgi:hypothetical protein